MSTKKRKITSEMIEKLITEKKYQEIRYLFDLF